MHTPIVDRRTSPIDHSVTRQQDTAHIVQRGMAIQARLGTRGAVEFLKMCNIPGAIIHRVLTGENVPIEDDLLLGQASAKKHADADSVAAP
ncbi:hypothetical protein [Massilia niabensis]|uniref:Uncharacterized protein n=1 Tax=Massilia niabensis TaxID=544910 RepID=A0ABW0L683_9BURK